MKTILNVAIGCAIGGLVLYAGYCAIAYTLASAYVWKTSYAL